MTTMQAAIVRELYRAMEKLGAPPKLLGVVGSWGETLSDEDVWKMLRMWNEEGRIDFDPAPQKRN